MEYAIRQIFYDMNLQPRVAANSYHKKFANPSCQFGKIFYAMKLQPRVAANFL